MWKMKENNKINVNNYEKFKLNYINCQGFGLIWIYVWIGTD